MPQLGPGEFSADYTLPEFWINGEFFKTRPVKLDPISSLIPLLTHGGTNIVQRPWRKPNRAALREAGRFSMLVRADEEATWYAMKKAWALGEPFLFCCGLRRTDKFAAVSGQSYALTRPLATGIVPFVSEVTHPTVTEGGTGSVSGQVFSATSTATIFVHYTPVHWCIFTSFPEDLVQRNQLDAAIELSEMIVQPS